MDTLNNKIKAHRKNTGMTQVQMATTLGITQSAYQQIETGNSDSMRVSTLRKLCQEFGLSADWLLGIDRGDEIAKEIERYHKLRNEVYKTVKAIDKANLSNEKKAVLIDQLQKLIDNL